MKIILIIIALLSVTAIGQNRPRKVKVVTNIKTDVATRPRIVGVKVNHKPIKTKKCKIYGKNNNKRTSN